MGWREHITPNSAHSRIFYSVEIINIIKYTMAKHNKTGNTEARSRNQICSGKAVIIAHFGACTRVNQRVCVWVWLHGRGRVLSRVWTYLFSMQRACAIFAAFLAPPHFLTLPHKRHDFRKKITEHKMCVLIFCTRFISKISYSKENLAGYRHKCENVFM